jgi:CDK-activating kinase assembly factor MAT1
MVEDLIYNLSNNIDLLDTAKRIADYKEKNKDFIAKNRHRQSKEALELQDILSEESMMGNFRWDWK